ncbi:pectinesterase 2-like [Macadamia integrifolia]|uniref:pectinesterase 2-like n=1 Tax=Macadamia integrifolia TaxID=60698 RepID=UPI001C4FDB69|nr:pectinesterase 2-like [Macadamia integrifolia]
MPQYSFLFSIFEAQEGLLMARKVLLALFLTLLSSSITAQNVSTGDINWWCNQTPYADDCKYFMTSHFSESFKPKDKSQFLKMSVQVALEQTLLCQNQTVSLGPPKCGGGGGSGGEQEAWATCLELYDSTVRQLNRTINPDGKITNFDAQTWLSTALTNLETCRAGFADIGITNVTLPTRWDNVSNLISNTLAINKAPTEDDGSGTHDYPNWVSEVDRKLLQSRGLGARAKFVVAKDGSGNFRTIKDALDMAVKTRKGSRRIVIYVKGGVYWENIEIDATIPNIMLVGDGMRKTIISGSKSVGGSTTTFTSATFGAMGEGFIARGITFRNTAGPKSQAVALRSGSDHSAYYRCGFEGYQDTLYVHSQRQFYKECYIYGTIDFIFGNAAVVFQNCIIYVRKPIFGQANVITAQGRIDPNQNTGISIYKSSVMAASDLRPVLSSYKTFLGRPWKQYSQTVYLETYLDNLVHPKGWTTWGGNFALNTLYYGEYKNYGPASSTKRRVRWRGYHVITNPREAARFTVSKFIAGRSWLPSTGVPYSDDL